MIKTVKIKHQTRHFILIFEILSFRNLIETKKFNFPIGIVIIKIRLKRITFLLILSIICSYGNGN